MGSYRDTNLWRNAFSPTDNRFEEERAKLSTEYGTFRERAGALTSRISAALPSLTIHDVTHLDALWETADLIAGNGYPLNPAEAFVFGGAVLLHDSALCFEAYEGGQDGLRKTTKWKDTFASFERNYGVLSDPQLDEVDFAVMRALHAGRARDLALESWDTPEGDPLFLISDPALRKHYGELIGSIAASHHWPIEDVESKFPNQLNAPAFLPRDWQIDPVKLACLLRCADAAHIDSRRAPDFLRAISKLHGVSASHWTAQNWLERADLDSSDPNLRTMIFTSGKSFPESESNAWWVAYDSIEIVDKELRSSAELLGKRNQNKISPPFQVQRVAGAGSPPELSRIITTKGWTPRSVEIHVSRLERLISELGGQQLYGANQPVLTVVRELIQNSRDAIAARRKIDTGFTGRVVVKIDTVDSRHSICVQDDGVGMSYRVITGPMLDFGSSFWSSAMASEEFPGLLSSGHQPIGRFGIGFYSIFMAASSVFVSSKRFDQGRDDVTQVKFPNGLSLRPIISLGSPDIFPYDINTSTTMLLKAEIGSPSTIELHPGRKGYHGPITISIEKALASICAGLDVRVDLHENGKSKTIHIPLAEIDTTEKVRQWLRGMSNSDESKNVEIVIEEHIDRIRPILDGDTITGLAAINTSRISSMNLAPSVKTVGGLSPGITQGSMFSYIGSMDYIPGSAKREASEDFTGGMASVQKWADEQMDLLSPFDQKPLDWLYACSSISNLGIDPYRIATTSLRMGDEIKVMRIGQIIDILKVTDIAVYKSAIHDFIETHHEHGAYNDLPTIWPLTLGSFHSLQCDDDDAYATNSIISNLNRAAKCIGAEIDFVFSGDKRKSLFGDMPVWLIRLKNYKTN